MGMTRSCGDCQLCCKLLPMASGGPEHESLMLVHGLLGDGAEFTPNPTKAAGVQCPHQCATGCAIYQRRPLGCRYWVCRWLVDEAGETRRPDLAGYVLDIAPDYVQMDTGEDDPVRIPVMQVWADPDRRDAWRDDQALRKLMLDAGESRVATLVRYNASDAVCVFPPNMCADNRWHERGGDSVARQGSTWPGQELQLLEHGDNQ